MQFPLVEDGVGCRQTEPDIQTSGVKELRMVWSGKGNSSFNAQPIVGNAP
jgi:hypothetical protein